MMNVPTVRETSIPGLLAVDLVINGDERGWFKESYQREKLRAGGFPLFEPVQHNVAYNSLVGVTRGIHAEPWNKYISISHGRVFAAIVDLRAGDNFGRVETFELTPATAIFVPRGCGNSYQTLESDVVYSYLVDKHWSADAPYTFVNVFDLDLAISWPIAEADSIVSPKDRAAPALADVTPAS